MLFAKTIVFVGFLYVSYSIILISSISFVIPSSVRSLFSRCCKNSNAPTPETRSNARRATYCSLVLLEPTAATCGVAVAGASIAA